MVDTDTATGTINDNDSAEITVDDVITTEGNVLQFTVTLDNAVANAFNVNVTVSDLSALGGAAPLLFPEDYDNVVATLNFAGSQRHSR